MISRLFFLLLILQCRPLIAQDAIEDNHYLKFDGGMGLSKDYPGFALGISYAMPHLLNGKELGFGASSLFFLFDDVDYYNSFDVFFGNLFETPYNLWHFSAGPSLVAVTQNSKSKIGLGLNANIFGSINIRDKWLGLDCYGNLSNRGWEVQLRLTVIKSITRRE